MAVYVKREYVDEAWGATASMVETGRLGPLAKVSTALENLNSAGDPNLHVIIVYATDWRDNHGIPLDEYRATVHPGTGGGPGWIP